MRDGPTTSPFLSLKEGPKANPSISLSISILQVDDHCSHWQTHPIHLRTIFWQILIRSDHTWVGKTNRKTNLAMPTIFRLARETSSADASTVTETNAPSILAINGFFCGFTLIVVLARIYVRSIMLKTFGPDDYLITAAMVRYFFSCAENYPCYDWQL